MIKVKTPEKTMVARTMIDTGNTVNSSAVISEKFHKQLGVGFLNMRTRKIGTAKENSSLMRIGRSNQMELRIDGIKKKILIKPLVMKGLTDQMNIGSHLLNKLGMDVPTSIQFSGGETSLVVGEDSSPLISNLNGVSDIRGSRGRARKGVRTNSRTREKSVPQRQMKLISFSDQRVKGHSISFIRAELPESEKFVNKNYYVDHKVLGRTEVVGAFYKMKRGVQRIAVLNNSDRDVIIQKGTVLGDVEFMEPLTEGDIKRMVERETQELEEEFSGEEILKHQEKIIADLQIEENEILKTNLDAKKRLVEMVRKYWKTFGTPSTTTGLTDLAEFRIKLKPGAVPHKSKVRPLNPAQKDSLDAQLDIWINEGVIEETESPWAHGLVAAPKKACIGRVQHRWAVDYRPLNSETIADTYPLPSISQNIERLAGSRVFSALDTAAAYNCIPVAQESRPLLAFITHRGLFTYKRMPFGPKNSAAVYARFIENLLRKLNSGNVQAYLDDVLIHTGTLEEHLDVLERVLELHEYGNLKLRPHKCKIIQKKVDYLGYEVSEEGVSMRKEYIDKILEWPRPKTNKELQTFLGFVSYYRQFIVDFSKLTSEMNGQKKKDKLEWTDQMSKDFEELKSQFKGAPIRGYPRYDLPEPFILTTDWSKKAVGGVLSQVQDGAERMIACVGRKCTKHEANYASVKGELAALVFAVRKFEHLLRYRKFIVKTDSSALKYLRTLKTPTGLWFRWAEELGSYDFEVEHKPGVQNKNADAISRRDDLPPPTPEEIQEQEDEYMQNLKQIATEVDLEQRQQDARAAERSVRIRNMHQQAMELTKEELVRMQKEDPILQEVRGWVMDNRKPDKQELRGREEAIKVYYRHFESLKMDQDILYVTMKLNDMAGMTAHRVAMPLDKAELVFEHSHSHPTAGHFGAVATVKRARRYFYYPGMMEDMKRMSINCSVCLAKRKKIDLKRGTHNPVASGYKGEMIAVDLVGPYPESPDKKRYCLSIIDCFTNFCCLVPISNKRAPTVANALIERWISVFGFPAEIKSDNGTEFCNTLMDELMDRLQIKKSTTPTYSPWANKVERLHRTLTGMLRTQLDREDINWPRLMPILALAYNTKVNETTGVTPYLAQFGEEAKMPIDLIIGPPSPVNEQRSLSQYVEELVGRFKRIYKEMRESHQSTIRRNAAGYKGISTGLKKDDLVYYLCPRQVPGKPPKLTDSWLGPYRVVEQVNGVLFKIKPHLYEGPTICVHEARLIKCTGPVTKNRIPERLRIQDEGDEAAGELRPPGDLIENENIPIGFQEGPAMVDLPILGGNIPAAAPGPGPGDPDVGRQELPDGDVEIPIDPGQGSGPGTPDQVEETMEMPLGPLPDRVEDAISTDISDPDNWSGEDTPPPLVPKEVAKGKRRAEDSGARPRDQKTLKRKVEKRSRETDPRNEDLRAKDGKFQAQKRAGGTELENPGSKDGRFQGEKRTGDKDVDHPNVKDSRVQGEKRAGDKPIRESKRVKDRKGRGDKRTFEEMKLDQALYGGSSDDDDRPGKVRVIRRFELPVGMMRKVELELPTVPEGQIAILQICPGLADKLAIENRCVESGDTSVWISNLSSHQLTFRRGQRLADSKLLPVPTD